MAEFIYCISNPSIPGTIRIDRAQRDPREMLPTMGSSKQPQRIDWIVRVSDGESTLREINETLAQYKDESWPGHFRCAAALARSVAIEFTASDAAEEKAAIQATALPSLVLGLGLAVQFLGITNGQVGMSAALIAAALFWVVYTLPAGTGGKAQA